MELKNQMVVKGYEESGCTRCRFDVFMVIHQVKRFVKAAVCVIYGLIFICQSSVSKDEQD